MNGVNQPSKSVVRKAGSTLRRYARGQATAEKFKAAIEVIQTYRATFSTPLIKVNNGLRSFTRTLEIKAEVSQRLKRLSTIQDKLTARETGLDLSRMRDIGGCRVVTESNDSQDLYRILQRIESQWGNGVCRVIDYVENPRESGYRAIHVEVERDARIIEVQLRTKVMHTWAETAEAFTYLFRTNYKQDGDTAIHKYMQLISKHSQAEENGLPWTPEDNDELASVQEDVQSILATFLGGENEIG